MNGLIVVTSIVLVTLFGCVIVKMRRANRHLWGEIERLKNEFCELKIENFQHNRALYNAIARAVTGIENVPFNAQHGEDFFLFNYFNWKREGIFVEVGAYDGDAFSNTRAFASIGWTGLLVEANPVQAEMCRINRPESVVIQAAVGGRDASGTIYFNRVVGAGTEVLSFIGADEEHLARCIKEGGKVETVQVPFRSLNDILQESGCDKDIDLLSVDVEGGEYAVLQGLDWERYAPKVIIVENNKKNDSVRKLLEKYKYTLLISFECNDIYII